MTTATAYDFISVKIPQAIEILVNELKANHACMLWGAWGIGKTEVATQVGNLMGFDSVIVLNPATTDIIDMRLPDIVTEEDGRRVLKQVLSERLPRTGKHLIVIDELPSCPPCMQVTLNSLALTGMIDDYALPEGSRVIATGNCEHHKCAANSMPQHTRDRFQHMYVIPDSESWCNWAVHSGKIRPEVIAFVRQFPDCLDGFDVSDVTGGCGPRSLVKLSESLDQNPSEGIIPLMAMGRLGQGEGTRFVGYRDLYNTGIDPQDCIDNPTTAPIPDRSDIAYAVCTAIATLVDKKNVVNAMKYIERLDPSYQVIAVGDMRRRNAKITQETCISNWVIKNQDIIL